MRSRNGNNTSSFSTFISICVCFLYISTFLQADEYFISYRYTVKNSIIYNKVFLISKAMKKCTGTTHTKALILNKEKSNTLKDILLKNEDIFFQYLFKIGLNITNHDQCLNNINTSFTIITLKTTCFKVDFNENFVKIAPLK